MRVQHNSLAILLYGGCKVALLTKGVTLRVVLLCKASPLASGGWAMIAVGAGPLLSMAQQEQVNIGAESTHAASACHYGSRKGGGSSSSPLACLHLTPRQCELVIHMQLPLLLYKPKPRQPHYLCSAACMHVLHAALPRCENSGLVIRKLYLRYLELSVCCLPCAHCLSSTAAGCSSPALKVRGAPLGWPSCQLAARHLPYPCLQKLGHVIRNAKGARQQTGKLQDFLQPST